MAELDDTLLRELEDDLLGLVDEPAVSPGRSQPSRATSPPTRMSPRRVAISRTILA